jgi:two-component sensor histidine kinase
LCVNPIAQAHRMALHTIVSELISNAIDHGLLRDADLPLDPSAHDYHTRRNQRLCELTDAGLTICAELRRPAHHWQVALSVAHSGDGRQVCIQPSDSDDIRGRGLMILDALCDTLQISADGRRTEVSYNCV